MKPWNLQEIGAVLGVYPLPNQMIKGISTDTRSIEKGDLFVALSGPRFNGADYISQAFAKDASAAVSDTLGMFGIEKGQILLPVPDAKEAYLALGAAYRNRFSIPFIGVTGSVGKTTTKDMIALALSAAFPVCATKANLNNELGVVQTILSVTEQDRAAVVEMGMDHKGEIALLSQMVRPSVGVITNVGVSHLENLGSRANILLAKLEIVTGMEAGAPLILNYDNDLLSMIESYENHPVLSYGIRNQGADVQAASIKEDFKAGTTHFVIEDGEQRHSCALPVLGTHQVENALAVDCVLKALQIPPEPCLAALSHYRPSGMRQRMEEIGGITLIEDCYNASPESVKAAFHLFKKLPLAAGGRKIAVLGDMLELGDVLEEAHKQSGWVAGEAHVDSLFLYGPNSRLTEETARLAGIPFVFWTEDWDELERLVLDCLAPGDLVLIKGSHSMGLERLVEAIRREKGEEEQ